MGMACRAPTDCATRQDGHVFLYAFDLIELNGEDLRREAIERRKAALAKLLRHTMKNLKAPAVTREAEENFGRGRDHRP
jgi:ATP-dependent DNA ligase